MGRRRVDPADICYRLVPENDGDVVPEFIFVDPGTGMSIFPVYNTPHDGIIRMKVYPADQTEEAVKSGELAGGVFVLIETLRRAT